MFFFCFQDYTVMHQDTVTAISAGLNFYASTANFNVNKGDVIALIETSGVLKHRAVPSSCFELRAAASIISGNTLSASSSVVCFEGEHQFLAHMVKVSSISICLFWL